MGAEISGENLILTFNDSDDRLTIEGGAGKDMQFVNDYAPEGVIAQVADNSLTINDTADLYWAAGKNASITVGDLDDTDETLSIKLDGSKQANEYRGDIKYLDASNYDGKADLAGNDKNNVITASKGGSTLTGGKGKDTLIGGDDSDKFVYAGGDGKDLVQNFTFGTGETADSINTGAAAVVGAEIEGENLVLTFDDSDDRLTIEGGAGKDMQFVNDYASDGVIAQVAETSLEYDGTANLYWATGKNATLTFNSTVPGEEISVYLDGSQGNVEYRGDIRNIDGSGFIGKTNLVGDSKDNIITAGNYGSTLWGGDDSSNDTLIGGNGDDVFIYKAGNGDDVISNASAQDVVNFEDITLDMISSTDATSSSIKFTFATGGSLSLDTNNGTTFNIEGVDYTYDTSNNKLKEKQLEQVLETLKLLSTYQIKFACQLGGLFLFDIAKILAKL